MSDSPPPAPDPIEEARTHPAADQLWRTGPIWLASDRALARYVGRPVASFLRVEAAGGIVLLVATVVALVWANSAWSDSYEALWRRDDRGRGHGVARPCPPTAGP